MKMDRKTQVKYTKMALLAAIVFILAAGIVAAIFVLKGNGSKQEEEVAQEIIEEIPEEESLTGVSAVDDAAFSLGKVYEALIKRPKTVPLPAENVDEFANIESVLINADTGKVEVSVVSEDIPESDDKYYYIFKEEIYEHSIPAEREPITKEIKNSNVTFQVNLNYKKADSRLFSKFVVAVLEDGEYVPVTRGKYISNPEAAAHYNTAQVAASKKGLLVDPAKLNSGELEDLGVKQAAYNIPLSRILGNSTSSVYDTIYYNYNGNTYTLNGHVIAEYDHVFSSLTSKGIVISAILLNDNPSGYPQLTHEKARSGNTQSQYYMFNGQTRDGAEMIEALGSYLATRYSGYEHGTVTNWIIGNEVNARKEWNYMELVGVDEYTQAYADSVRLFYNAIKSVNGAANVYISLDQQWNRDMTNKTGDYDGRDILDSFNTYTLSQGNYNWGVAQHPYSVPLTSNANWKTGKYVSYSVDTPMITMANVYILTDYISKDSFKDTNGEVRSVLLSELGYTSSSGQEGQAAAYAYAYKVAEANQHIDGIILSRETDAAEENAQGLALGLCGLDGSHKYIYNVFKYIDTDQAEQYTEFAKGIIGISKWSDIIVNH